MKQSVFLTYNRGSDWEESTAMRLQTLANLYKLNLYLPYRDLEPSQMMIRQIQEWIKKSNTVIGLLLDGNSQWVLQEIEFAIANNKTVIVIYDDKNFSPTAIHENFYPIKYNEENSDETLHQIILFLNRREHKLQKKLDAEKTLLTVGLGLLAAWGLSKV